MDTPLFDEMVQLLIAESQDINPELLPVNISYDNSIVSKLKSDGTTTLKRRIPIKNLVIDHTDKIKTLQKQFTTEINKEYTKLLENFVICCEADTVLGKFTPKYNESKDLTTLKRNSSGDSEDICSICGTKVFKIKRHLNNCHTEITTIQKEFALEFSSKIKQAIGSCAAVDDAGAAAADDEEGSAADGSDEKKLKKNCYQNTSLVNKKQNFRLCHICGDIYQNLNGHYKSSHSEELTDQERLRRLETALVIPRVYTKKCGTKYVRLEGDELVAAKNEYEEEIAVQKNTMEAIKLAKSEMDEVASQMSTAKNEKEHEKLKEKYIKTKNSFKAIRYLDTRDYTKLTKSWKCSYSSYLEATNKSQEPEKMARMAIDVLLHYEKEECLRVDFATVKDSVKIRDIAAAWKNKEGLSYGSKSRYLAVFQAFLKFLLLNRQSPEYVPTDDANTKILLNLTYKEIEEEIEIGKNNVNKMIGKELIEKKTETGKKIIPVETISELKMELEEKLLKIIKDDEEKTISRYTVSDAIKVRNLLISVGTFSLGRRSLDTSQMRLSEVEGAQMREVDGEKHYIVKVLNQKSAKHGELAPVVYKEQPFRALKIYIEKLRPLLCTDQYIDLVFPAKKTPATSATQELTLPNMTHILKQNRVTTGQTVGARIVRKSRITNSDIANLSENEKFHLKKTMNNSSAVQDKYYNFRDVCDNVAKDIERENRQAHSTPTKKRADLCESGPSTSRGSSVLNPLVSPLPTPMSPIPPVSPLAHMSPLPHMSPLQHMSPLPHMSPMPPPFSPITPLTSPKTPSLLNKTPSVLNKTIQTLRGGKKIKTNVEIKNKAKAKILEIMQQIDEDDSKVEESQLYTKGGKIKPKFFADKMEVDLFKSLSSKEIRDVATQK